MTSGLATGWPRRAGRAPSWGASTLIAVLGAL